MERTYTVTMTKIVKLRMADAVPEQMMEYAAAQVAAHGEIFVKGLGRAALDLGGNNTPIAFTYNVESVCVAPHVSRQIVAIDEIQMLRDALRHLVHNVKATGKRLDLGLSIAAAERVLRRGKCSD